MKKGWVSIVSWAGQIGSALILLQTLFFKFTGSPESVFIFSATGMEPWGRYGIGIVELIASILLLTRNFNWLGALIAFGVMCGAIVAHVTVIGIEVMGDGGLLFGLAILVWLLCAMVFVLNRQKASAFLSRWR